MTAPAQPWLHLRIFARRDAAGWVLSIGGVGEASCGIHAMTRLGPGESPDNPQDLIPALEATLAPIKADDLASCEVLTDARKYVWPPASETEGHTPHERSVLEVPGGRPDVSRQPAALSRR